MTRQEPRMTAAEREALRGLADRVEALQGPCRETDAEIAQEVGRGPTGWASGKNGRWTTWPAFTASLDAAMTLVPERSWTRLDVWPEDLSGCMASVYLIGRDVESGCSARAATPALALTAAALRARAAQMEDEA